MNTINAHRPNPPRANPPALDRERPLIATSLAPKNLPRQKAAVASWIAQGFDVVSINCAEEIAQLTPHFPDVGFRPCTRDARALAGKPLVPLDDLLAALRAENRALSGIVNSDIVLKQVGTSLLSSSLKQAAGEGLAFAKRLDQATESEPGVRYDGGIDVFFFGRKLLFGYPSTPYFVGLPWWDYFFAAYPILARYPTVEIGEPIAFHIIHPSFYDLNKHWIPLGVETVRLLSPLLGDNAALVGASGMNTALQRLRDLSAEPEAGRERAMLHAFILFAEATVQLIEAGALPDRLAPQTGPFGRLRLGIPLIADASWSSGVQVIVDLVTALSRLPAAEKPELVLVIPSSQAHAVAEHSRLFPLVDQIIEVGFSDVGRRHAKLLVVRDFDELFEHIDFLYPAHMMALPGKPAATWIPDFEHHRLPKLFQEEERATREQRYQALAAQAGLVILNSHSARRDWRQLYPDAHARVRVLPLRTMVEPASFAIDPAAAAARHGISEPFFLCSNPFWVHKGYSTLVAALARMVEDGHKPPLIVCAGSLHDRRFPGIFALLHARMEAAGVADRFRILGPIPRAERIALMRQSLAIVQPSHFEGWSAVVEEARVLGKTILLSDIEVHREQAPPRAHFYWPSDTEALARLLRDLSSTLAPGPVLEDERLAQVEADKLLLRYARAVCALASEAASTFVQAQAAAAVSLAIYP